MFIKQPPKKFQEQEFGPGKKGYIICEKCGAVYHEKSWHHKEKYQDKLKDVDKKLIKYSICPACIRIRDDLSEGFLVLKNVPEEKKEEILALVKHIGERNEKTDVLDRIAKIYEDEEGIKISTTENQLAVKIGRQLEDAYKKSTLEIHWANEEGPARLYWTYPNKDEEKEK